MKNFSKRLFTLLLLFVAVAIFSMAAVIASEPSTPQVYATTEDSIEIETKYKKVSTYKITFNANGGKIGSKTKEIANIKKGSKIKNLPATPKRTGHVFKGWYTKKSSGQKISANTKPTKSLTYYAQWQKTTATSKVVGEWQWEGLEPAGFALGLHSVKRGLSKETLIYNFYGDGSFQFFDFSGAYTPEKFEGKYSVSNGKVYLKNVKWYKPSGTTEQMINKYGSNYQKWNWELLRGSNNIMTSKYKFGSDSYGDYLEIAYTRMDPDPNYIYPGDKFYKT